MFLFDVLIEVRLNHELCTHRLYDRYNATNVSCVCSENAKRHGALSWRAGHARYQQFFLIILLLDDGVLV